MTIYPSLRRSAFASGRHLSTLPTVFALLFGGLANCQAAGPGSAPIPPTAQIWFHPLPSASAWPGGHPNGGSEDFLELFQENAPWARSASHTQAFGLYAGWIVNATDAELSRMVAFLNAHKMGIEIEAPALRAEATCGSGVEGYVPYGQSLETFTLTYLRRLKLLGAQVAFIKVDEPFFFGHVVADLRSCHFSVPQIAAEVGEFAQLVKRVYPDAEVGDVEPVVEGGYAPNVLAALVQWHEVYTEVTGAPFPFFFADVDFSNSAWPQLVKQLENLTHQQGSCFGIIYIGDLTDGWDGEWTSKALSRFFEYQGTTGGRPDYVLFQSWEPSPAHSLPESDPYTLTGVIAAYLNATLGPGD